MMGRLRSLAEAFARELSVYRLVVKDTRTPWLAKVFLGAAIGYAILFFDLIPDFVPVLGHLDDLVMVPLLVYLGLKLVPKEIIEDCRMMVNRGKAPFDSK